MTADAPAPLRLGAWSVFLALTLRLLHGHTLGMLSVPLGTTEALAAWTDRTAPAVMALAVVRLAALAATWYLTVLTVLVVATDVAGWSRTHRAVTALAPDLVRRVAARGAGAGLVAGSLVTAAPMPAPLTAAASAAASVPASDDQDDQDDQDTATMTRIPSPDGAAPSRAPVGEDGRDDAVDTWTVEPGDSLWAIAEETVADLDRPGPQGPVADADVIAYWRRLVESNRDRLADATNPDLLLPGQELVIPPP